MELGSVDQLVRTIGSATKLKSSELKRESRDNIEAYLEQQILPFSKR